ncbi:MAG: RNA polymerase, sigma-24 subunit, ECF subfamily [Parcubacteria group bacterium GW2011_GWA2_31_28]|nr:MAG: RNA polymerase, sigma-24 subunit, ECF subfamily [Parcubacteria group bacterium GW2011_GWA2_31_28]
MNFKMKDKQLIQKIYQRDEKTLLSLYHNFKPQILNYIRKQIHDFHLAEEITQDVFIDFIDKVRDFHFECSIKTYLFSIARNKIIDTYRKKKLKKILFSALPDYIVESLKTIIIDEEIEKKELQKKLKKVFDKLPNDYGLVLRLKYIEGEKVINIAKKISLGFKATESLIFRARKAFIKLFHTTV